MINPTQMKHLLIITTLCATVSVYAQSPDSAKIYYLKGLEAKEAQKNLVASNYFDKAITFQANYLDALQANAAVNLEMRKTDRALQLYVLINKNFPTDKTAINALMTLYFNYRQFDQAILFASKCANCANAAKIQGISYYNKEDYTAAAESLLSFISKNADDAEAIYTLARTYVDMEEYKKAVGYYEKVVGLPEAKAEWMNEQGILLSDLGNYPGAMAAFVKAADHGYIQSNDFNENLGFACLNSGEFEKGEKLIMSVWSKKTGNRDLLRGLAEVLYQKKQYDRSLIYCQKLMELDEKDGKALYQAGLCFQKKGEKDRGQKMCDKAIQLDGSLESLRTKKEMTSL